MSAIAQSGHSRLLRRSLRGRLNACAPTACERLPRGVSLSELAEVMKKAGQNRICPAFSWEDVLKDQYGLSWYVMKIEKTVRYCLELYASLPPCSSSNAPPKAGRRRSVGGRNQQLTVTFISHLLKPTRCKMKQVALAMALIGFAVGSSGTASAQGFGVYLGTGHPRYHDQDDYAPYYAYHRDCRVVLRKHINRRGERVMVRRRICD